MWLITGIRQVETGCLDRLVGIARTLPDVRFLLVGDGTHRGSLERDLAGRAEFTGVLRREALAAAYRRADVFVVPSKHDTFGQVVMEAMATGFPVVVTDQGGAGSWCTTGSRDSWQETTHSSAGFRSSPRRGRTAYGWAGRGGGRRKPGAGAMCSSGCRGIRGIIARPRGGCGTRGRPGSDSRA